MVNSQFTYTLLGKKRAPSKELVLQWIHKAWQEIPADLVANAFKSCGILNALMKLFGNKKMLELMKQTTSWRMSLTRTASRKTSQQDEQQQQPPEQLFSEPPQFFSELPDL